MASKDSLILDVNIDASTAVRQFNQAMVDMQNGVKVNDDVLDRTFNKKRQTIVEVTYNAELGRPIAQLKEIGGLQNEINRFVDARTALEEGSVTRLRQQVNQAKQARDAIAKMATAADLAADGTGRITAKVAEMNPKWTLANERVAQLTRQLSIAEASNFWDKIKAELNLGGLEKAGRAINDLVNTFQSLSIIIGQITAPINALLDALGKLQQFSLTFNAIGLSATDASEAISRSSEIALTYGASLNAVREGFIKLSPTILAAGGTLDDVGNITDALSSRFAAFGMSADQSNRVMAAVVQAFGKGKLMAEELTQQISEADPAFRVNFAQALGVSVAKLNEMVKAGEINNQVMLETLPKLQVSSKYFQNLGTSATSASDALERGQATVQQVRNQITTLNQTSFEALAKSSQSFLTSILQLQAAFTDLLADVANSAALETLANILGSLVGFVADVVSAINVLINVIDTLVRPIFSAINSVDKFIGQLTGIMPIAGSVAALVGIAMVGSFVNFLNTLKSTGVITAFFSILQSSASTGFGAIRSAVTGLPALVASIFNGASAIITGFTAALTGAAGGTRGLQAGLVSLTPPTVAATQSAITYLAALQGLGLKGNAALRFLAAGFVETAAAGQAAAGASTAAAGGFTAAAAAAGNLLKVMKATLVTLGPMLVIMLAINAAMAGWEAVTGVADKATKGFKDSQDEMAKALERAKAATNNSDVGTAAFGKTLDSLVKQNHAEYLNRIPSIWESIGNTLVDMSIDKTINATKEAFKQLQVNTQDAETALRNYSVAAGESNEALKSDVILSTEMAVAQYASFIKTAEQALVDLQQQIEAEGEKGATADQAKRLNQLQEYIAKVKEKRDAFIAEAEQKGIIIKIAADGKPAFDTFTGLKEEIKKLEGKQALVRLGTKDYEKTQLEINGLKRLAESITETTYEIKIRLSDADLQLIDDQLNFFDAIKENIKAIGDLEKARFDAALNYQRYLSQELDAQHEKAKQQEEEKLNALDAEKSKIEEINNKKLEGLNTELEKARETKDAKLEGLQEELDKLKESGATKEKIAAKEKEIKEYTKSSNKEIEAQEKAIAAEKKRAKEEEAAIEKQIQAQKEAAAAAERQRQQEKEAKEKQIQQMQANAAVAAYNNLLKLQDAERQSFAAKQIQERLEREILGLKLQQAEAELLAARAANMNEQLKAMSALRAETEKQAQAAKEGKDIDVARIQELKGIYDQTKVVGVELDKQIGIQGQINDKFRQGTVLFNEAQKIQADTFVKGQEASRVAAAGQAAQYGVLIGQAGQLNQQAGEYNRNWTGTIQVGDKVVQIFGAIANTDIASPVAGLNNSLDGTKDKTGDIKTGFGQVTSSIEGSTSGADELKKTILNAGSAVREARDATTQMSSAANEVTTALTRTLGAVRDTNTEFGVLYSTVDEVNSRLDYVAGNMEEIRDNSRLTEDAIANATNSSEQFSSEMKEALGYVSKTDITNKLVNPLRDAVAFTREISSSGLPSFFGTLRNHLGEISKNASIFRNKISEIKSIGIQQDFQSLLGFTERTTRALRDGVIPQLNTIIDKIKSLDGFQANINIKVTKVSPRFAGGPLEAGELAQVNELGKEAFLTRGGSLKMINAPKNGLWRAPASGTVIPAHITRNLNIPKSGVKVSRSPNSRIQSIGKRNAGGAEIARALYSALESSGMISNTRYSASSQALHATQIGKLTHAINKLVDKNWDVNVNIKERNAGLGSFQSWK